FPHDNSDTTSFSPRIQLRNPLSESGVTRGASGYHHHRGGPPLPPHEARRTSNIERPTPNIEWQRESSLTSAFEVRCFPRFNRRTTRTSSLAVMKCSFFEWIIAPNCHRLCVNLVVSSRVIRRGRTNEPRKRKVSNEQPRRGPCHN